MKIPEVSLITPTCHHHHINSSSPPLSFAGDFAVCNSLIWMYKRALFKMDASVFWGWGAQHQQTLLKKSPILATLNPSIKSFATSQRNLPPPICRKLKYQFPTGEVLTLILLSILNPLGFSPGEFWQCMLDFRENGICCCCCCWGGDSVLHCLNWQQVLTAGFLAYLGCDIASSDTALTGRCDGRQRTTTPACVVLHYSKKLVWILQQGLWCGDPWLQVLPASCFPLCMAHFWYFLHISSISFIDILLQLSIYTPVPLQKNMAHENTSQTAMPLARSEEVNVRNIAKGA